jgi:hypothetical protein
MARALGIDRPRDAQGRFATNQPPETQEGVPQQPAQQTAEKPATEEAAQEYNWDDLKNIKVKVPMKNGEKEWVDETTLEQMRNERMMHSDYMARRREMDEQSRTMEVKQRDAVDKERKSYMTALETLHQSIVQAASPELANVDWNKLASESPAEYVRLSNRAREVNAALERVRFEHEKAQQQQSKERQEHLDKAVAESKAKLREAIPNWSDELYGAITKRGAETYGFKPEEIKEVWDHRVIQVLHDAHQFRLLKEGKQLADKKVETTPPVLRPGPQKPKVNPQQQEIVDAHERVRRNPNDLDAGAALMATFLRPKQGRA